MSEFPKIKLPKGSRTLSGELLIDSYGGDMWDDLKKYIENNPSKYSIGYTCYFDILMKMKEIEKEYGIDYVE